jgi:hypothetical protein
MDLRKMVVETGTLSGPMAGSGLTGVEASGVGSPRDVLLINCASVESK